MSCVSIRQRLQRNCVHNLWSSVAPVAVATLLCCVPSGAVAQTESSFEQPPVLEAKELVPQTLLRGKGVRVEDKVPTDGVMGTFTIHADADVYGEDAGTYQVRGREIVHDSHGGVARDRKAGRNK